MITKIKLIKNLLYLNGLVTFPVSLFIYYIQLNLIIDKSLKQKLRFLKIQ